MPDVETRWTADEQRLSRMLHRAVDDAGPAGRAPAAVRPVERVPDLGRRRRWPRIAIPAVAACVVAAVVVGIGLATREAPAPAASSPPRVVVHDPSTLLGTWTVDLSEQPEGGVSATFGKDRLSIAEKGCGTVYGTSSHPDGLLLLESTPVATVGFGPCAELGRRPWMDAVLEIRHFVVEDDDRVRLLDRDGVLLATLKRQGTRLAFEASVGVVGLPAGMRAPTRTQLVGTWYETGLGTSGRSLWFGDGTWIYSQSVSCNSRTEPYALSTTGGFDHLRDPNSGVQGCGARLPAWLTPSVARVGLDGDELVLLDAGGRQVARLDRGGEPSGSLLDQVQGDWEAIGMQTLPTTDGIGLRIKDDWLRHDGNATCNTADEELRLSGDGWVVGSRSAQAGGCEPGGEELLPGTVRRVLLIGDQLVVIGLGGDELRRFERAGP